MIHSVLIKVLFCLARLFNFHISSISSQYWAHKGFLMIYINNKIKLSSSADSASTKSGKAGGHCPLWIYVTLCPSGLSKLFSSSFCHFLLFKINFTKTSQIKTASVQGI